MRPITFRALCFALIYTVLFSLSFWLAAVLRFEFAIPPGQLGILGRGFLWAVGVKIAVFCFCGHFHGWWRHVSFADLAHLVRECVVCLLILAAIDHFVLSYQIPRSILLLDAIITLVVVGGGRSAWRMYQEQFLQTLRPGDRQAALFVGAYVSDGLVVQQIHASPELKYRIKGFLSTENSTAVGTSLAGVPVLGAVEDIAGIASSNGATEVLMTAGRIPGVRLRRLMDACDEAGLKLRVIPPIKDLVSADHHIPVRDVDIDDLLRREPVALDKQAIRNMIEGRTVMVSGAGGSIGSEICRQVLQFAPKALVLLGKGENRIYDIDQELSALNRPSRLHVRIGDVTDKDRMRQIFQSHRPDIVFHAAAHKHVPLMEDNVGEAVKNNVLGTKCVADLAHEFGIERFVLVSTDKAVHPTSVMGATKHIAERYVHALAQESSTLFIVTRFGNVLGSRGSVVPLFKRQIRDGGPITITDPKMTRFFMTIPEASGLVLQAAAMGRSGEILVLDMGSPVKIVDLAKDLIRLSGLPAKAIEIVFSGIRPGEKLYEELYFDEEETLPTSHPKLRAAYHRPYGISEVAETVRRLEELRYQGPEVLRQALHEAIPEYMTSPTEETTASTSD